MLKTIGRKLTLVGAKFTVIAASWNVYRAKQKAAIKGWCLAQVNRWRQLGRDLKKAFVTFAAR